MYDNPNPNPNQHINDNRNISGGPMGMPNAHLMKDQNYVKNYLN